MAQVLVSTILTQLDSLKDAGVRYEVLGKMKSNFQAIEAVLEDAEIRQMKEKEVRDWLDKVKEISYDIDDALDEWNTTIRKSLNKDGGKFKPLGKVCSPIPYHYSCSEQIVVKKLNGRLDVIAAEKDNFKFSITRGVKVPERKMTSHIDLLEVHGNYDQAKHELLRLLLSESSQGPIFPIISVVGLRGSGKTTLVRLVFNTSEVDSHFDKKIWVQVSGTLDEISLAKLIFRSVTDVTPNVREFETSLQLMHQSIKGKKFLLVLDDVQMDNPNIWEQLKDSLKNSSQGSRILVTTYKRNIAEMIGTTNAISLGKLPDQVCWELFEKVAFSGRASEEHYKLEDIGKKIVCKCNGSPLSVKMLGGLLSLKTGIEEWERILSSELWKLEDVERGFCSSMILSYYDMPSQLRKCFLYCVIFPKGYKIKKDILIKLWLAEGCLNVEGREDMEVVGEEYFENLAMRSLFHDFERSKYDNSITSWKMPNMVHDFAKFITKNEFSNIEVDVPKMFPSELFNDEARHLFIIGNSMPKFVCQKEKLRSLFTYTPTFEIGVDLSKFFDQLTCLRTLVFSGCSIEELPRGIGKLIHLRNLNLSQNVYIKELPESLCELYNLQILDVSGCNGLQKLPLGIGKLINLRHLINHETPLTYMPKGIEKLTCLHTLSKFPLSNYKDWKKACSLECLGKMLHLEGFLIITGLGNVGDVDDVNKTKLKEKEKLFRLGLRFDGSLYVDDRVILEKLQLPPNLKEIMIQYYASKTMPLNGLKSLNELRVLKLSFCIEFESLPSLGTLSSLESLYISNMPGVKSVGNQFLGIESGDIGKSSITSFPKLKALEFEHMSEWKEWEVIAGLPCLRSLIIGYCPKLEALPDRILKTPTLQQLEINFCSSLKDRDGFEGQISHISNCIIDGKPVQKGGD